ncbi:MAG: hypothetical protein U0556_08555 [Dehalococcoidia bacterium]
MNLLATLMALLMAGAGVPAPTGSQLAADVIPFVLTPVGGGQVQAAAILAGSEEGTFIALAVEGLPESSVPRASLHSGSCRQPSASIVDLPPFEVIETGSAATAGPILVRGRPVSLETLTDGDHVVVVRVGGSPAACGSIPRGGLADQLPFLPELPIPAFPAPGLPMVPRVPGGLF